ncbi:MAG: thiamine phosphate synthase [Omnitrophica bacterium]|nr:thiamine phosphate synthase [Candidatus Omnitrophota bacterium]
MKNIDDYSLYLVTSQEYSGKKNSLDVARLAIESGIDILQMREKTIPKDEIIRLGRKLSTLCKKSNIVFIINDDPYLAKKLDADGVHLGQEDLKEFPIEKVRQILGKDKIIGLSTHSLKQVKTANNYDINYIGFGPIFKTKTKNYSLGTKDIPKVLKTAKMPIVFIGGINSSNIEEILPLGVKNIAVIREITHAQNIRVKVLGLKNIISKCKKSPINGSKN